MTRKIMVALLATSMLAALAPAAEPDTGHRGAQMIDRYFRDQVRQISGDCLKSIATRADWEKQRPELRRQFLEMLGLWPMPPRSELKATITGTLDRDTFRVEKLHFQSMPGLYVTGNLYVPRNAKALPAILYVCGHGNTVVDGVSYGSKVNYQHHPAWFAQNGYVCLVLDTLQLGEIPGIHHGTSRFGMWWWQSLGYTPAGIECWNAIRALDYLQGRPEVDPKRLGVTGRSGGGATSWWLAAADDRPQAIVPVAGIADLHAHLVEGAVPRFRDGVISGHCDCMYMVNTYRWDFPLVMALCAPRPLLLGNSGNDDIFPVEGYRRMADKVRRVYDLHGAGEKFQILETAGPHKDTPELRLGAFRWMNKWLRNEAGPVVEREHVPFAPRELKVFEKLPDDAINAKIQEQFITPAPAPTVPAADVEGWWRTQSADWKKQLRKRVFGGWPDNPPPVGAKPTKEIVRDGVRLRAIDFTSETGIELRLWIMAPEKVEPSLIVLTAVDEPGWNDILAELGPAFAELFPGEKMPPRNEAKFLQNQRAMEANRWAFATVAPRGVGPTRWVNADPKAKGPTLEVLHRRRFALIGQTLEGQQVWDVRRAIAAIRTSEQLAKAPLWLQGHRDMAGVVLYAAVFEPTINRVDLWHPPATHRKGPAMLNLLKILDMPQAVALVFPNQVRIYSRTDEEARVWDWPLKLQSATKKEYLKIRTVGD